MIEWNNPPAKTALIVWDMQRSTLERVLNSKAVIENTKQLLVAAREVKLPIIFTQTTGLPYEYLSFYSLYQHRRAGTDPSKIFKPEGSAGWQLTSEIIPNQGEIVLKKHVGSLFVGTSAEMILKNRATDILILTGVVTEGGIENTARHASTLGYLPLIAEDAVGSSDAEANAISLKFMSSKFEVRTTEYIIRLIREGKLQA